MILVTEENYVELFQTEPYISTVGVDIDGTLNNYDGNWKGYEERYEPLEDAEFLLKGVKDRGYRLAIVTARRNLEPAMDWFREEKLDKYVDLITNWKIPCLCIIDDRVIRFVGTAKQALQELDAYSPWWKKDPFQDSLGK